MNLNQFGDSPINEILEYVVFDENTLGYLFKTNAWFMLGILNSNSRGVHPMNSPYMLGNFELVPKLDLDLRKATLEDFENFRVSQKGHLHE